MSVCIIQGGILAQDKVSHVLLVDAKFVAHDAPRPRCVMLERAPTAFPTHPELELSLSSLSLSLERERHCTIRLIAVTDQVQTDTQSSLNGE